MSYSIKMADPQIIMGVYMQSEFYASSLIIRRVKPCIKMRFSSHVLSHEAPYACCERALGNCDCIIVALRSQ
jgi:hypothetical protein